jgi:hypothetical protein
LRTMAARWSVSKTALLRHRETHLAPALGLPPPAAALGLVPLCASRAVAEALDALQHALQANPHFYRDMELAMLKVQRTQPGPLTDVLAAWVGHKA